MFSKTNTDSYQQFAKALTCHENAQAFEDQLNQYFSQAVSKARPPVQNLNEILEASFIVGESHSDISPKRFLIENMENLKAAGVEILFLEHLSYDHQHLLDNYMGSNDQAEIPPEHKKNLMKLDHDSSLSHYGYFDDYEEAKRLWQENNFTALVQAAKAAGIRVVALDTDYIYKQQYKHMSRFGDVKDNYRTKSFNYVASQIIEREANSIGKKWCALIGNTHVQTFDNVPGVAELTGARKVYIFNAKEKLPPTIEFNQAKIVKKVQFDGDVFMSLDAAKAAPQLQVAPAMKPKP